MSASKGPYIQTALLCDKLLQERDGSISAIRITDRFTCLDLPPTANYNNTISAKLLVSLKAGSLTGKFTAKVELVDPCDKILKTYEQKLNLKEPPDGCDIIEDISFKPDEEGLYRLNTYLEREFMTCVQFQINFKRLNKQWEKYSKGNPYSSENSIF